MVAVEGTDLCRFHSGHTVSSVPNQPKTPIKCFRIPADLYEAAQAKAAERGESVSEVVRKALERYVRRTK